MASTIRYRFRSSVEFDTIYFDGVGLRLWELKDEIIQAKKMGPTGARVPDFDLVVINAQTEEEYQDENQVIPKNTLVILKRVPRKSSGRQDFFARQGARRTIVEGSHQLDHIHKDEDAKIQAMKQSSMEEWNKQLDIQDSFGKNRSYRKDQPQRVLHPNYVCYRCGEKGHFISDCPLGLANPNDQTRIKRVTGIPKSFLKPAESEESLKKTLISYDGSRVTYRPNTAEWQRLSDLVGKPTAESSDDPEA